MLIFNLKALVVVLAIALAVFALARPLCIRFMTARAFAQRRNVWLVLTAAAFLSPSFWLFSALAAVLVWRLARHEANPIAVFLLLAFLVPPIRFGMSYGTFGIADLTLLRLLSLVILLPWMIRHAHSRSSRSYLGKTVVIDRLIVVFGVLQVALMIPHEPLSRSILRTLLFFLDVYVLYYVASRSCTRREHFVEAMACLALAGALLAPMGLFEAVKTWPLYGGVSSQWGAAGAGLLYREGIMRSAVTTGHALTLGYFTGIAFGMWLYLRSRLAGKAVGLLGAAWMWMGLLAAYSRAPWLMAVLLYFAYAAFSPAGMSGLMKAVVGVGGAFLLLLLTPVGDRLLDILPFIGSVDSKNVEYRQQLVETTWALVQQNPWFGDRIAATRTEDLINGQGILDLVNAYAAVALFNGLVGLGLYVSVQLLSLWLAFSATRRLRGMDADGYSIGANLIACMIATIFFQASSGAVWMQYVVVGLLAAYASWSTNSVTSEISHQSRGGPNVGFAPSRRGELRG